VPSYLGFKDRANKAAAQSDVRAAIPSAEALYADTNSYATIRNPVGRARASRTGKLRRKKVSQEIFGSVVEGYGRLKNSGRATRSVTHESRFPLTIRWRRLRAGPRTDVSSSKVWLE